MTILSFEIIKSMSTTAFNELTDLQKNQLACNLAVLILHDDKQDVTSENLTRVLKGSGLNVPSYWSLLMAKSLEGKNVEDYMKVTGGGSGGVSGQQAQAAEEEKEESVEEESEDMSMGGLFD